MNERQIIEMRAGAAEGREAGRGSMKNSEEAKWPEQGRKLASFLRTTVLGSCPPGPALTKAAVDDSKAAAQSAHKSRRQFKAVLGFQDTSQVWRLGELLIEGSWIRCYGQGQQGFLHGRREDGSRAEGQLLSSTHNYRTGGGKPGREQKPCLEDSIPPFLWKSDLSN